MSRDRKPIDADRFHTLYDRPVDGCWMWRGTLNSAGYGRLPGWIEERAHRIAWILANGPIPNGLFVCHRCDVRACVRPDHLFLGTVSDNHRDMVAKNRHASGERHGMRMHPERVSRGDAHYARREPWRLARGPRKPPAPRLPPKDRPRGEAHGNAKLTADAVVLIRAERAGGRKLLELARMIGVSESAICDVLAGRTWRHVP